MGSLSSTEIGIISAVCVVVVLAAWWFWPRHKPEPPNEYSLKTSTPAEEFDAVTSGQTSSPWKRELDEQIE